MPINIMKVMTGASENHKVHYNPRTVPKPPEELQILISPFIGKCKISLNALDASYPGPTACALLELIQISRTVLLQDIAKLIYIGHNHILFDHEVFKTELFLNTFCITNVHLVSHSMKAVLP